MDFDFSDRKTSEEPVWFNLVDPATGDDALHNGLPIRIAILGPDTAKMRAVENRIQDKRLEKMGKTGKVNLTSESIENEALERAKASVVGWENLASGGTVVQFSQELATSLLTQHPWFLRFWEEKYRNAGNFLGSVASTETS